MDAHYRTHMVILFDTSFLLAVSSPGDKNHVLAKVTIQIIHSGRVIAAPMLLELKVKPIDVFMGIIDES